MKHHRIKRGRVAMDFFSIVSFLMPWFKDGRKDAKAAAEMKRALSRTIAHEVELVQSVIDGNLSLREMYPAIQDLGTNISETDLEKMGDVKAAMTSNYYQERNHLMRDLRNSTHDTDRKELAAPFLAKAEELMACLKK